MEFQQELTGMRRNRRLVLGACSLALVTIALMPALRGEDDPASPPQASGKIVPLNKQETVLLDRPGRRVLVKSKVVLREGLLEMLACPLQTKEHESILAV